jgi:hypothetical protein
LAFLFSLRASPRAWYPALRSSALAQRLDLYRESQVCRRARFGRRTYHLELHSDERTYMASVFWTYPEDQLIALRRQNDRRRFATKGSMK